jgi:hypothetical protein
MRSNRRTPAFALMMTVLLITMLVAVVAQLAATTASQSVIDGRRHRGLDHRLAMESALLLLAGRLDESTGDRNELILELDRAGRAAAEFEIGAVRVSATIQDDAAKFNPYRFQRSEQDVLLERKLGHIQAMGGLPATSVKLRPLPVERGNDAAHAYRWFDQLLDDVQPGAVFDWGEESGEPQRRCWSDAVTLWGDGRVALRRVRREVLEAALEDIRPGLAGKLLRHRLSDRAINFLSEALAEVDAEVRDRVAQRVTFDAHRFAIVVETAIEGDRRGWYVVAEIADGDVAVLHRSRMTW